MKSYVRWEQVKDWLKANPGKTAAIVTPDTTYIVKVAPPVAHVTREVIVEYVEEKK